MTGFAPLLKKELLEQWRAFRLLTFVVVLAVLGIGSMVLLLLLPQLLEASGEAVGSLPEFVAGDAFMSYQANAAQLGAIFIILVAMGSVARERERGQALIILSKPVTTAAYIAAKLAAYGTMIAMTGLVAGTVAWLYANALFDGAVAVGDGVVLVLTLTVFLVFAAWVTIGASAMFRSRLVAGIVAAAGLLSLGVTGGLPWIGDYMPGAFLGWGAAAVEGVAVEPRWGAFLVTVGIAVLTPALGWHRLRRDEV